MWHPHLHVKPRWLLTPARNPMAVLETALQAKASPVAVVVVVVAVVAVAVNKMALVRTATPQAKARTRRAMMTVKSQATTPAPNRLPQHLPPPQQPRLMKPPRLQSLQPRRPHSGRVWPAAQKIPTPHPRQRVSVVLWVIVSHQPTASHQPTVNPQATARSAKSVSRGMTASRATTVRPQTSVKSAALVRQAIALQLIVPSSQLANAPRAHASKALSVR